MPFIPRYRNHCAIAAIMLAGWLLALVVSIVHSCVSNIVAPDQHTHVRIATIGYAATESNCIQLDEPCEIAFEAQASSIISEKLFEPPNTDRLLLITSAYGLPLPYVDIFKPDFLRRPVPPFERIGWRGHRLRSEHA
ncbi:hypothetical protein [Noviherbaspirillum agri]